MTNWTPLPNQYADVAAIKLPAWIKATDASRDPILVQFAQDATAWVKHETGRVWLLPAAPVTLAYDAPLSNRLLTADFVDVADIIVKVGGVTVDPSAYTWLWRTIDGAYPHAYGLRLLSGTWADSAHTAGRPVEGDVTLEQAKPATTATPPGPLVQAVQRKTVDYYLAWRAGFAEAAGGTEETGVQPPATIEALGVLGPYLHPRRLLGRP